jgi:Protein of unknown function (DUF1091)
MFKTPELNFCHLLQNAKMVPFFDIVVAELKKFGNFPLACPIEHGRYEMHNLSFPSNLPLPKNVLHFARIKGIDAFVKPPRSIVKYEVYAKFV